MKSLLRVVVSAVLLIALTPTIYARQSDSAVSTTLPNGMKVIVREGKSVNLTAVDIWIRAGSVNETDQDNGISHFVEHMIFKATKKYGPGQIDREIEGLGAALNGGTSRDWVHFYTTVASEHLPLALEAIADAIVNPQFREDDVEKERRIILDEIARADSDPSHFAFRLFAQTAFTVHPYRLPPMGDRQAISGLTKDDLVAYYKTRYTPGNTCVAIAGDISSRDAVALVEKAFYGYDRVAPPGPNPPVEPAVTVPRVRRFAASVNGAYVVLGYHVPGAAQFTEACVMDVILAVLGDTHHGRVSQSLNARGIPFKLISTDYISQRYPTTIATLVAIDPEHVNSAISVLRDEYVRLGRESLTPGELSNAKRLMEGADLFEQETFSGQARALGLYESIASYDLALKYAPAVRQITADQVTTAARRYFGEQNYCAAILEPTE